MNIFKNIFQEITFVNKVRKAVKQAKTMLDVNQGLAKEVKRIISNLIQDVEALLTYLPQFKPIYKEVIEIVKEIF